MSKPKPHLDPNGIDILLEKVSRDNCRMLGGYHDAEMSNEISRVLGCYDDIAVNTPSPDEYGSDMLRVVMYQNLLLGARRWFTLSDWAYGRTSFTNTMDSFFWGQIIGWSLIWWLL